MALLRTFALKKLFSVKSAAFCQAARAVSSHYIEDLMPGDLPKTEKERLAAAEKYGLLPHEYETYDPNAISANGDYPNLPVITADMKDPYYPWDYPEYRRNYNEVWHADWDMYGEDRVDDIYPYRTAQWKMVTAFFCVIFGLYGLFLLAKPYPVHRPVCVKQLPSYTGGQRHYSFPQ